MTKEEYEKLLQSDYWKGFSYSLIKERNFTCEDCGRTFYNQRNKLQVHHLVYRDINPWSYKPEEMVVLCEECHKKRHGFIHEEYQEANTTQTKDTFGDYTKTYSYSTGAPKRRMHHSYTPKRTRKWNKRKIIFYAVVVYLFFSLGVFSLQKNNNDNKRLQEAPTIKANKREEILKNDTPTEAPTRTVTSDNKPEVVKQKQTTPHGTPTEAAKRTVSSDNKPEVVEQKQTAPHGTPTEAAKRTVSSDNKPEGVEQKQTTPQTQPQREKTVLEILEERNHADVVRQAQQAGVSTEGTTIEILERINHADVVRQAERAGVSTEGTTIEILERINHADVVRQAERAGVSTEGTTIEILERITRKDLERGK